MAKQLYDYWFVQFDFPNEEGKPYKSSGGEMVWNEKLKRKIPNEWDNCKLKDFINLFDSKRIPLSSKDREERKGNYPYYGATGIMDYVNEYIFDGDYILLAEDGSTSDSKGFPIVQYIWGKNWVNNHAHIILPKNEQYLMFTYQMLRSIPAKQIETGSIQKKISQENLCEYNMVLPNSILIEKYESIISPLWEKRKLCIEEINALIKQRDELLPLLMNGQASVNSDLSVYKEKMRGNTLSFSLNLISGLQLLQRQSIIILSEKSSVDKFQTKSLIILVVIILGAKVFVTVTWGVLLEETGKVFQVLLLVPFEVAAHNDNAPVGDAANTTTVFPKTDV